MRQRRQISTRAHAALRRNHRMHAAIEHVAQRVDDDIAHAGKSFGQRVGAQQDHGADDRLGQRLAHSHSVGAHQIELQLADIARRDADVAELAHAGVHRVRHLVAVEQVFDHGASAIDRLPRFRSEQHGPILVHDLAHIREGQTVAVNVKGFQDQLSTTVVGDQLSVRLSVMRLSGVVQFGGISDWCRVVRFSWMLSVAS